VGTREHQGKLTADAGLEELVDAIQDRASSALRWPDPGAKAPTLVIPVDQAEELLALSGESSEAGPRNPRTSRRHARQRHGDHDDPR